ncbi:MAG: F0F1 ATP synthase subunit epsilon [Simkaniaceae bacterium]
MNLKILTPSGTAFEGEVIEIIAEGSNGSFALLPRHIDFLSKIVPGIVVYVEAGGDEGFIAVDEGILVKQREVVFLSVREAVTGADLGELKKMVEEKFQKKEQEEKKANAVVSKLESDFIKRFLELRKIR